MRNPPLLEGDYEDMLPANFHGMRLSSQKLPYFRGLLTAGVRRLRLPGSRRRLSCNPKRDIDLARKGFIGVLILLALALTHPVLRAQDDGPGTGQGPDLRELMEHGVRGTVTAISGNNLTVKTEQGEIYKIETGANTRLRKGRDPVKIADIHAGDMVGAFGEKDEKARTLGAVVVVLFDKEQYEKARADFGKTWTTGVVQSIDETKIAIKRPDNVTQTIVVDENTSFRKRRESVTLADIKVGDNVTARGSVQGGNQGGGFLATVLAVGGGPGRVGPGTGQHRPDSSSAPGSPTASPNP